MRAAMQTAALRRVYDHIAGHYDIRHSILTGGSDQRGRSLLVDRTVQPGDLVLDCGAGTGTTGLMAARRAGPAGRVIMYDLSEGMLGVAREKAARAGLATNVDFEVGDMVCLPFADASVDVALSTYSFCPVYDPDEAAAELLRVVKPGGRIGVAHSTQPTTPWVRWLADRVEDLAWLFPNISMGCRAVSVLPFFERRGCRILYTRRIGVPLWPFLVFVVETPCGSRRR